MKSINYIKKAYCKAVSFLSLSIKTVVLCALVLTAFQVQLQAQEATFNKPSWWFGAAGAANLNFYRGSTHKLNESFTPPVTFHDGFGLGLYLAPLIEFYRPYSRFGLMLQAGYDNRKGTYDEVESDCNCPTDLSNRLSYITVEPSLRFAPFKSNFFLYGGPRFAYNLEKSFTYQLGINPNFPEQLPSPAVTGDMSDINQTLISMQVGAGLDIPISSQMRRTQYVISPFVSFHPYFGQDPRSIETWNITTVRAGLAVKFGRGKPIKAFVVKPDQILIVEPDVEFVVHSPKNVPVARRVRETFPLRNYVFFNLGSTDIPDRYVLLRKDQVADFKEDQLEVFKPKNLSGRSDRQMIVYYNVLNILGDRMNKYPASTVRLSGSSMESNEDGLAMAESVKKYLTDIFAINPARITTEGRVKPRIPSEQVGGELELDLLRQDDRRVSIFSTSPELVMEFQSGQDVPLRPLEFVAVQEAPVESYVTFSVDGADTAFTSWSLELIDKNGFSQNYGPYTKETVTIPGKTILGTNSAGTYKVIMTGQTASGNFVKKETSMDMVLWTPSEREEGMRFSIIYEFDDANAILMYEKYLTEVVTPKIPVGATVLIHGHSDNIGDEDHNQRLSLTRAKDVKGILEKALAQKGRTDVIFEIYGYGEDQDLSPFNNNFPEERFYNRTVIIDIIPAK